MISKTHCPKCGAETYPTDEVCMSCGAHLGFSPPGAIREPLTVHQSSAPQSSASAGGNGIRWIVRLSSVLVVLTLCYVADLDVMLHLNKGEVAGWVGVSGNGISFEPLANFAEGVPWKFSSLLPGIRGKLKAVVAERGVDPWMENLKRSSPELYQAQQQIQQSMSQIQKEFRIDSPPSFSKHVVLCRLRYAGLGRNVVYAFETFSPSEEQRLAEEVFGRQYRAKYGSGSRR